MGFRTIVILNNDLTGSWSKDASLGEQIAHAMNHAMGGPGHPDARLEGGYGNVVACQHADTEMLVAVHGFTATPMAHSHWQRGRSVEDLQRALLEEAAEKLGYRLVPKKA